MLGISELYCLVSGSMTLTCIQDHRLSGNKKSYAWPLVMYPLYGDGIDSLLRHVGSRKLTAA